MTVDHGTPRAKSRPGYKMGLVRFSKNQKATVPVTLGLT